MRKRITLVAFTVAGAVALAAPTPIQAFWGEWIPHIPHIPDIPYYGALDYGALVGKAAKASVKAQKLGKLADELANAAKTARREADIAKTPEAAAKAEEAEAKAARAQQDADRAAEEAAEGWNASDEAARDVRKKTGKDAFDKIREAGEEGAKTDLKSSMPALLVYLIALVAIVLGGILFLGGIISLLAPRYKSEKKRAPFTDVEKGGVRLITTGERPGVWLKV
jgi:hypothetical protein